MTIFVMVHWSMHDNIIAEYTHNSSFNNLICDPFIDRHFICFCFWRKACANMTLIKWRSYPTICMWVWTCLRRPVRFSVSCLPSQRFSRLNGFNGFLSIFKLKAWLIRTELRLLSMLQRLLLGTASPSSWRSTRALIIRGCERTRRAQQMP